MAKTAKKSIFKTFEVIAKSYGIDFPYVGRTSLHWRVYFYGEAVEGSACQNRFGFLQSLFSIKFLIIKRRFTDDKADKYCSRGVGWVWKSLP